MNNSSDIGETAKVNKKAFLISQSIRTILNILIEAAILFTAAGQLDWLMGWLYLIGYSTYLFFSQSVAPVKLKEHSGRRVIWESVLVFIYRMTHPVILVLAGLEFNSLQQPFPFGVVIQSIAFLFLLATFALIVWAEKVNPQYHAHVTTKEKQEQEIVTTGPYQFIRHPGYLGLFMLALARPLVLGSLLGLGPGIIGAVIMLLRTALEDRSLQKSVDGYKSYAQTVRYRLFEGIW